MVIPAPDAYDFVEALANHGRQNFGLHKRTTAFVRDDDAGDSMSPIRGFSKQATKSFKRFVFHFVSSPLRHAKTGDLSVGPFSGVVIQSKLCGRSGRKFD